MTFVMIAFLCHVGWTVDCRREFRIENLPSKEACEEVRREFVEATRPRPRSAICAPQQTVKEQPHG